MSFPQVHVVVLNWNGLDDTVEAVRSLLAQDHPALTVHVVDNASADAEADALAARFAGRIVLHRNSANLGFTGGNHVAMRAALADHGCAYVALLNNDAAAEPDWVSRLVACAESDPSIGVVASTMLLHDRPELVENTGVVLLRSGEAMPRDRGRPAATATARATRTPIGACGGAVLYRASMLREIGLFAEDFFANFEDVELSLRALATGWDVRYAPDARVRHRLSRSIGRVRNEEFLLRSQRNLLWANATRLPWQALLLNLPAILAGHLALLLLAPLCGQRLMARVVWRSRLAFLREVPAVLAERRRFRPRRRGPWLRIWWRQSSFLPAYVRSFRDVVVRRRRRFFE